MTITEQEKRPLFSDISKARQLYNERKSIYKKQSKYIINGDASALEIARKIIECMDKEVQE